MRDTIKEMKNGITNGWYPLIKKVMPRIYHKYLAAPAMENIYGCKCFGKDECTHVVKEEEVVDKEISVTETDESKMEKASIEENSINNTTDEDDPQQPTE